MSFRFPLSDFRFYFLAPWRFNSGWESSNFTTRKKEKW